MSRAGEFMGQVASMLGVRPQGRFVEHLGGRYEATRHAATQGRQWVRDRAGAAREYRSPADAATRIRRERLLAVFTAVFHGHGRDPRAAGLLCGLPETLPVLADLLEEGAAGRPRAEAVAKLEQAVILSARGRESRLMPPQARLAAWTESSVRALGILAVPRPALHELVRLAASTSCCWTPDDAGHVLASLAHAARYYELPSRQALVRAASARLGRPVRGAALLGVLESYCRSLPGE